MVTGYDEETETFEAVWYGGSLEIVRSEKATRVKVRGGVRPALLTGCWRCGLWIFLVVVLAGCTGWRCVCRWRTGGPSSGGSRRQWSGAGPPSRCCGESLTRNPSWLDDLGTCDR